MEKREGKGRESQRILTHLLSEVEDLLPGLVLSLVNKAFRFWKQLQNEFACKQFKRQKMLWLLIKFPLQ